MQFRVLAPLVTLPLVGLLLPFTASSASARTIVCHGTSSNSAGTYYAPSPKPQPTSRVHPYPHGSIQPI